MFDDCKGRETFLGTEVAETPTVITEVKLEPFYGRRLILHIIFTTVPIGKVLKRCVTV